MFAQLKGVQCLVESFVLLVFGLLSLVYSFVATS
jgi:hypothetical protein